MERKNLEEQMERFSTEIKVAAGKELCTEGTLAREAMFLTEGSAEVFRNGKKVADLKAGELIGEMGVSQAPYMRTATVIAKTDCVVKVMTTSEFSALKRSSSAFRELVALNTVRHDS